MSLAFIILFLGHFGNTFSGTDLLGSLLPFAVGILLLVVGGILLFTFWRKIRSRLRQWSHGLPAASVAVTAVLLVIVIPRSDLIQAYGYYKTLVGAKEEAKITTIRHQVYANYRRLGVSQVEKMIVRAKPFISDIEDAAVTYGLEPELLKGLAATESSYLPRKSTDGGDGLFQITQVPQKVRKEVDSRFEKVERKLNNSRYNAFLGAATLAHYLKEMDNDLFLGLLAYNMGPANGGLRFIMEQYGAKDFTTIQPYLHRLPRDYPIRVLSYGLAFLVYDQFGKVLPYEENDNAMTIQRMKVPGL